MQGDHLYVYWMSTGCLFPNVAEQQSNRLAYFREKKCACAFQREKDRYIDRCTDKSIYRKRERERL